MLTACSEQHDSKDNKPSDSSGGSSIVNSMAAGAAAGAAGAATHAATNHAIESWKKRRRAKRIYSKRR